MNVSTYGDNLIKLTRLGLVNCYLVREPDGFTLIDTGMAGSAQAILLAAQEAGLPIIRIALTHAHTDHVGSLDALAERLPHAELLFTQRTAGFLSGDLTLLPDEPQEKMRGGFVESATKPTAVIEPGMRVGSLQVIAAPGHSPDHIAFFDERDGTLIAGDAFQSVGGLVVSGVVQWLFPFPALATWHKPTATTSARILAALNPSRLAVGHGKVLENPAAQIEEAIRVADKKYGSSQTLANKS